MIPSRLHRFIRSPYLVPRVAHHKPTLIHVFLRNITTGDKFDKTTEINKSDQVKDSNQRAKKTVGDIVLGATKAGAKAVFEFLAHPTDIPRKMGHAWQEVKDVAKHYWVLLICMILCFYDVL